MTSDGTSALLEGLVAGWGWAATAALLAAYGLLSTRRLASSSAAYQGLNVFGAAGLAVAAWHGGVWPAVALNVVWAAIGVLALVRGPRPGSVQPAEPSPH